MVLKMEAAGSSETDSELPTYMALLSDTYSPQNTSCHT